MIYTSHFTHYASTAWVPMISESRTYAVLNYEHNIKLLKIKNIFPICAKSSGFAFMLISPKRP